MNITAILLLICCLQVSARVSSQGITLNVKNAPLEKVFKEIKKQTGYTFMYTETMLKESKKVSIEIRNYTLHKTLSICFANQPFTYSIINKTIVLQPKEKTSQNISFVEVPQLIVTGEVTDSATGNPIVGVSIKVKGSSIGTTTDSNGKFSLDVPNDAELEVSSIGYNNKEIEVNSRTIINISLSASSTELSQVVVVGYGTQKKGSVTGAISTISSKEIKKITSDNLVTGLQGKLPGLRVTQRNGEPGSFSTAFDVRGFGSPLIVVDGIVRNDFNRLDPNSIESITVLKDASAAIYGVKAANGVILVTTKKGDIGKPVITYSGYYDLQRFTVLPELTNAYQFAVLTDENELSRGASPGSVTYPDETLQKYKDGSLPSTDWWHSIVRKYANISNHNVSITGGDQKAKYFASVGYMSNPGIYKSGALDYKKYDVVTSATVNITDNLKVQLNIDGMMGDLQDASLSANNIFFTAMLAQPTTPIYANNNPQYLQIVNPENVLADSYPSRSGYSKTKTKTFQGNISLDYQFKKIEGLSARFLYGFYNNDVFEKDFRKKYNVYSYDEVTNTYNIVGSGKWTPTSMFESYTPLQRTTVQGQLSYERTFLQKHHVKASAVYDGRHEISDNLNANKQFAIDIDQLFAGLSQNTTASSSTSDIYEDANQSIIGRVDYDYLSKYLFEVGANYGGSSKFPKGKRWGFFPFASLGWKMSGEKFFKDNLPYITNLKIRASWGRMGDDNAANFQYLTGYNYPNGNYIFGDQVIPGLGFRGIPNPNITWFTATTKDIGIDLDILNGLITLQFDLFQRDRSGLLATRSLSLPGSVGANLSQENLNSDRQKGFELVVGHKDRLGKLNYNISGNLTYTLGENRYVERAPDGNSYLNWKNNSTDRANDIRWGYQYIGQFKTEKEILSSPMQDNQGNKTLRPGDLKYADVNHDGIINSNDQIPIGMSDIPHMQFALNIDLNWKNFGFNLFAQGSGNYSSQYQGMNSRPLFFDRNSLSQFMDRWHHENFLDPTSPWVPGYYPPTGYGPSNFYTSAFWLANGAYVRIKNVEIDYNILNPFLKRIGIETLKVNIHATNLFTWTNLRNIDPEQQMGFFYNYPINMNMGVGLTLTF